MWWARCRGSPRRRARSFTSEATTPDLRQWQEAERWLRQADDDSRAAETLLVATPPLVGSAAFHCQQAAEKIAKAALIAARVAPPRLHDIEELARRVAAIYPEIGAALGALGGLTGWYAAARYPDAGFEREPDVADIRQALSRIRDIRARIMALRPSGSGG